jgi:hypothetical protein
MYEISISKGVKPVTEEDVATEAVRGTGIALVEEGGVDGNWMVQLPRDLVREMQVFGYFELDVDEGLYRLRGEYA